MTGPASAPPLGDETGSTPAEPLRPEAGARRRVPAWAHAAFGAFSLVLTLGFFRDGIGADFSALSSDQYNILAMCAKRDHPELLQGDLIVGNPADVAYYTPLFVNLVRLASLPDHDYLRGLNILLAATSLVYLWGWWLLFSFWGDFWIAALGAFLVRGILWPPGNEVWGIAGIWSLVPRTLFLALLPWVLWFWFKHRGSTRGWAFAAFLCGLLANVHPISGAGVAVSLLLGECAWTLAETRRLRPVLIRGLVGALAVLAGLAPYAWMYVSRVGNPVHVDPVELDRAIAMRIPPVLRDPAVYWDRWERLPWLALVLGPWLACLLLPRRLRQGRAGMLLGLAGFAAGSVLIPAVCFPAERLLDQAGWHVRFAFQLIRIGKYVLVPSMIVAVFVASTLSRELAARWKWGGRAVAAGCLLVLGLTLVARDRRFNGWPILGDDVVRLLWPRGPGRQFPGVDDLAHPEQSVSSLLPWIRENTAPTAKFVGPRPIRAGSLRAVVHDWAGAVVLIEGNPGAFVEAARRETLLRDRRLDPHEKSLLVASWGADYWVTETRVPGLVPSHEDAGWFVYRLAH